MRHEIAAIERLVEEAVNNGDFPSKQDCASALINWLVLNDYVNPSRLNSPVPEGKRGKREGDESIDDRHAEGVNPAEETLLQYEILRDRDA